MFQLTGLSLVLATGLGIAGTPPDISSPASSVTSQQAVKNPVHAVVEANNQFAFDLYQRIRGSKGNVFFSPTSISMTLAMAYLGSSGRTEAEMARTLHFRIPKSQLGNEMASLRNALKTKDTGQGFQLDLAERLWADRTFRSDFRMINSFIFAVLPKRLDFKGRTEQSRQTINTWIEEETGKRISNLIPSAAQLKDARLVLTDAVYFKGQWQEPFRKDQTKEEDFTLVDNRRTKVAMMHKRGEIRYAHIDNVQLIELSYGDGSLSMIALLPDKRETLRQFEATLSMPTVKKWIDRLSLQEVIVALPEFSATSQFQLRDTLSSMGMPSAFDAAADFSMMTGQKDLFISAVMHKAFVDVNEEGTEAAAATAVVEAQKSFLPSRPKDVPVFRADHPFAFVIQDHRTGAILFLGRLEDPTK